MLSLLPKFLLFHVANRHRGQSYKYVFTRLLGGFIYPFHISRFKADMSTRSNLNPTSPGLPPDGIIRFRWGHGRIQITTWSYIWAGSVVLNLDLERHSSSFSHVFFPICTFTNAARWSATARQFFSSVESLFNSGPVFSDDHEWFADDNLLCITLRYSPRFHLTDL